MESSSFSGSLKRAKAPANITQVAHCLVDGCNVDLRLCRDYHRRHKVCEIHSKTSKVTIGGREQRFCQQCSRFHSLVEFDEGKRSCRKRLDGHNRRRRKPQTDVLTRNSGLVFSNQPGVVSGPRLLSFSCPQILPGAVVSSSPSFSWSGVIKPENDTVPYNSQSHMNYFTNRQNPFSECLSHPHNAYKEVNQLQFLQSSEEPAASICPHGTCPKIFSDGLNQVVDSDRALSLLSSAPTLNSSIHQTEPCLPLVRSQTFVHHNL